MQNQENFVWNWLVQRHPEIVKTGWRDPSVVVDFNAVRDYLIEFGGCSEGTPDDVAEKLMMEAKAAEFKEKHPLFGGWRRKK